MIDETCAFWCRSHDLLYYRRPSFFDSVARKPRAIYSVSRTLRFIIKSKHDLAATRAHPFGCDDYVSKHTLPINNNTSSFRILEVVSHTLTPSDLYAPVDSMLMDDTVQFPSMSIDPGPPLLLGVKTLSCNKLPFPVVQIQPRCFPCNFLHCLDDARPALEVARTVRIE